MRIFLLVMTLLAALSAGAQSADTVRPFSVIVHKDPRIDLLVRKQASINSSIKKQYGRTARGYRLMVLSTNKRDEAIAAKTQVYTSFPELKAYLVYQSPFFRLKVGNFRGRDEAARYQKQLNALFPKGVFIINDVIEIKPEKTEDEE
ncbi:SPOR domain-containing protein [Paraflavisolibacter sp. H34]|uniref:SPOR domain-containing protein n=1 Tax=Huijunlia imazamoxiresistens TaxID=3127457 RepID=UPI00301AB12B